MPADSVFQTYSGAPNLNTEKKIYTNDLQSVQRCSNVRKYYHLQMVEHIRRRSSKNTEDGQVLKQLRTHSSNMAPQDSLLSTCQTPAYSHWRETLLIHGMQ